MKKTLTLITLLILSFSQAQINVGPRIDVGGNFLGGILNSIDYHPKKVLKVHAFLPEFEKGYYYNKRGEKIVGELNFTGKKLFFAKDSKDRGRKIKADIIKSFVLGSDSFFVEDIDDFSFLKRAFLKRFTSINGVEYIRGEGWNSSGVESFYYYKKTKDKDYNRIRHGIYNFEQDILPLLDDYPFIAKKVEDRTWTYYSIFRILKYLEYINKFKNHEKIYFNENLLEVEDKNMAAYYGLIVDYEDGGYFTIKYFDFNDQLIAKARFFRIFPNRPSGELVTYWKYGERASSSLYESGVMMERKFYRTNGNLFMKIAPKNDFNLKLKVRELFDEAGNNVLDKKLSGKASIYDPILKTNYTIIVKKGKITESYRMSNGEPIYQRFDGNSFKKRKLRELINAEFKEADLEKIYHANGTGILLVSLLINKKGFLEKITYLNDLHPETRQVIQKVLRQHCLNKNFKNRIQFSRYSKNGKPHKYEITIPVSVRISRYMLHSEFWVKDYFPTTQFIDLNNIQVPLIK